MSGRGASQRQGKERVNALSEACAMITRRQGGQRTNLQKGILKALDPGQQLIAVSCEGARCAL